METKALLLVNTIVIAGEVSMNQRPAVALWGYKLVFREPGKQLSDLLQMLMTFKKIDFFVCLFAKQD